jgi:carboxymethylenebutenolidase
VPKVNVITETTSFKAADGVPVTTYLARPDGTAKFPALVLGYEFWGMLEVPAGAPHMRELAGRFAGAGYVAAVPDYYAARGQQPTMEGGTITGSPSDEQSSSDLCDAVHWLQAQPYVDAERIGVIGWCGGGRQALFLAAKCPGVRAAASFYGRPINRPTQPGPSPIDLVDRMPCPIFGAYGAADRGIAVETVHAFEAALAAAGKTHEIHVYPEAEHAFMNDRRPEGYNAAAAADAWARVLDFFGRHLGAPVPA